MFKEMVYNWLEGIYFIIGISIINKDKVRLDCIYNSLILGVILFLLQLINTEISINIINNDLLFTIYIYITDILYIIVISIFYSIIKMNFNFKIIAPITIILYIIYVIIIDIFCSIYTIITNKDLFTLLSSLKGELILQLGTKIIQYFSLIIIYYGGKNEQIKQSTCKNRRQKCREKYDNSFCR